MQLSAAKAARVARPDGRRLPLLLLGLPPNTRLTFDIFERLRTENLQERAARGERFAGNESSSSDDPAYELALVAGEDEGEDQELGSLLRGHAAREHGEAPVVGGAAEFPRDPRPRPPWTQRDHIWDDTWAPYDRVYTYREVVLGEKFELVCWPGNDLLPFEDRTGLVMLMGVGKPQKRKVETMVADVNRAFSLAGLYAEDLPEGRRSSITAGIHYPEGLERPENVQYDMAEFMTVESLMNNETIGDWLRFARDSFQRSAPKGYDIAQQLKAGLFARYPHLHPVSPGPWTNITFDLGPQAVTPPGRPDAPIARWCWLALTAFGSFDATRGGHLILWDMGKVVEFPAGTTFLIPPLMRFSIAVIRSGETRFSITQYFAPPPTWSSWPDATHVFSTVEKLRI
ncbi:hypothetical protein FB45DRAFT_1027398 [Roridomyces roridus]|uniref:Uncharacterized protein n=1 Tax=Roridomyces roridus TaxID=1738132 RepID=A0AAD7BT84_9AGAR|nr:hypothetical protein FB45DRAFT_1027398 [Roridomyces roridus]